jgi:tetratricopeptide (TPR) repeat protein
MTLFRHSILVLFAVLGTTIVCAQTSSSSTPNQNDRRQPLPSWPVPRSSDADEDKSPENQRTVNAPPREAGESSSRDQIIDLSPPSNDLKDHPDSEVADSDVTEFHQWDPHKAQKSVEVGDFYLKRKNYSAAIDRYREALQYKPNDAIATFHLAQALEQDQKFEDARKEYANYLKILPHGPSAAEARKALERLRKTAANQPSGKANQQKP